MEGGRVGGKLLLFLCPQSGLIMHGSIELTSSFSFREEAKYTLFMAPSRCLSVLAPPVIGYRTILSHMTLQFDTPVLQYSSPVRTPVQLSSPPITDTMEQRS